MKYFFFGLFFLLLLACQKKPDFFPDPYNEGLSRFTSRDYNVASVYVNDSAWVSDLYNWQSMTIRLDTINNPTTDTLIVSWAGAFDTSTTHSVSLSTINFVLPVKKNFTRTDFLNWKGKLFPNDSVTQVGIELDDFPDFISNNHRQLIGDGKIYFVSMIYESNGGVAISGLFEGNIGDSIILRKGRFDFFVSSRFGVPY